MPNLETDLSSSPYFDDFDVTKNYYQILYKPAVAVQTREINQMQTILQDQIDKFGRSIYKDGSVIEGCAFTYDNFYSYVKIKDNYTNNFAISSITDFTNQYVTNPNGLQAIVVNTVAGYESQDPDLNTLYIKYLNSATFANGSIQQTFANSEILSITTSANISIGSVTVATVANSTGYGYSFTTTEGTIFKKGFFLRVPAQTLIVSKYSNSPDGISVGFDSIENIITPQIDSSLFDNAAGSPNYSAPGANRLQIIPTLAVKNTPKISSQTVDTKSFFSICDFTDGIPVSIKQDPQYSTLGKELARRTFETNGNFVVNPFNLSTISRYNSNGVANTTYSTLQSSPGIAYVNGYRVEFINQSYVPIRKGTDDVGIYAQTVALPYGNYLKCTEFCGDFRNDIIQQIELHNTAYQALTNKTFLSTSYTSANKIGTAYVRSVVYDSGIPGVNAVYRIYFSDIAMIAGQNFSNVKSIVYNNGGSIAAVADVILQPNFQGANVAILQETVNEIMVQSLGQKAIDTNDFNNQQFVYRDKLSVAFQSSNGSAVVSLPLPYGTGSERLYYSSGTLDNVLKSSFIITPSQNGYSSNLTGTVTTTSSSNAVNGSSTTFLSNYTVGDYILVNGTTRRVTSISNNVYLNVDSNFVNATANNHQIVFPAGVPIDFTRSSRTISTSNNTINMNLGLNPNANFNTTLYFDVLRYSTVSIKKNLVQTYVKIDMSNNIAGSTGPWCLGLPDVVNVAAVYIGTNGNYDPTSANQNRLFGFNSGQYDSYYGLGYITKNRFIPTPNTTLLCLVNHFTYDTSGGVGFFNANSYPVDQSGVTPNTIKLQEIPIYTSQSGDSYDLRDCVDYRPFVQNTAVSNTSYANGALNAALATINPSANITFSIPASVSYIPSPDSVYQTDLFYYLPRIDRIALTNSGQMLIKEGLPSVNPVPPDEASGTSTIALITVPPYPSLSMTEAKIYGRYDYSYQITPQQIRRYTMSDIKALDNRISSLEYYTSLSLLEQQTQNLNVKSSITGQNRFKNGIFVDPFVDSSIGNTIDDQYSVAIDPVKTEARPQFSSYTVGLTLDTTRSSNIQVSNGMITLAYTPILYQSQVYASSPNGQIGNTSGNNSLPNTKYITTGSYSLTSIDNTQNALETAQLLIHISAIGVTSITYTLTGPSFSETKTLLPNANNITINGTFNSASTTSIGNYNLSITYINANNYIGTLTPGQTVVAVANDYVPPPPSTHPTVGVVYLDPPGSIQIDTNTNPDFYDYLVAERTPTSTSAPGQFYSGQWGYWLGNSTSPAQELSNYLTAINTASQTIAPINANTASITQNLINNSTIDNVGFHTLLKSAWIIFGCYGLRPNTRLYIYCDGVNLTSEALNLIPFTPTNPHWGSSGHITQNPYNGTLRDFTDDQHPVVQDSKGDYYTYGDNGIGYLTSDNFGNCFGAFRIPATCFKATGSINFVICDNSDLPNNGISSITTEASTTFTTILPAVSPSTGSTPSVTGVSNTQTLPAIIQTATQTVAPTSNIPTVTNTAPTTQTTTLNITNTITAPTTVQSVSVPTAGSSVPILAIFANTATTIQTPTISSVTTSPVTLFNPGSTTVSVNNPPTKILPDQTTTITNESIDQYTGKSINTQDLLSFLLSLPGPG